MRRIALCCLLVSVFAHMFWADDGWAESGTALSANRWVESQGRLMAPLMLS